MNEWLDYGCRETTERVKKDAFYQKLLKKCEEQERRYECIMSKLDPGDRMVVEDYIALCEELQYQKTHTAYYFGKEVGERGKSKSK